MNDSKGGAGRQRGKPLKRRDMVRGMVAAGVLGGAGLARGQAREGEPVSPMDVAAADRLAGRSYSDSERELMAKRLARVRESLKAVRQSELDGVEPAVHFDPRLPGAVYPEGKSSCRLSSGPLLRHAGPVDGLAFATVVELSRLLKARKVTSTELTRMYLERLKKHGPELHCVVTLTEELALRQAARADHELAAGRYRGPLHGIPWGAKDLLATRGIRTTFGAKPYEQQVFDADATVVSRLEEAGAVLLAKLSMGELAMGDVWFGGLTRNPWHPDKGSSGSSAGPGSATAAGLLGFSIGSETLGSIVSPSVVNGVTGLRPTYGRVPRTGAMALCWSLDKLGPMCRGVEDCALVLSAIHGPDGRDPTVPDIPFRWNPRADLDEIRVGIDTAAFEAARKDEKRRPVYEGVLDTLRELGIQLRPVTLPKQTPAYSALRLTIDIESSASFQKLTMGGKLSELAQQGEGNWPNTFRVGSTIPAADYLQMQRVRTRLQRDVAAAMKDVDLYVTVPFAGPSLVFTNFTGHPTVVTRCGLTDGSPQSVEFVGDLYNEAAILRVALAYEQATPWHKEWPQLGKGQ
jgi:Asp-tRNA(Asn)/Glu-tRNA(Gln) amidotransferase A subunit family amidase